MVPGLWACPLGCWQPPKPGVGCSRPAPAAWAGHLLLPAFKHSLGPSFWRPFHRPGYGQAHTIWGPFAVHLQGPRAPPSLLRPQMRLGLQQLPSSGWGSQLESYRMELRSLHRSWGPPEKEPGRGRKVSRRKWGLGGACAASDDKGTSEPFGSASHPPPRPPQTRLLKALTSTASTRIRVQVTGDLRKFLSSCFPAIVQRAWHVGREGHLPSCPVSRVPPGRPRGERPGSVRGYKAVVVPIEPGYPAWAVLCAPPILGWESLGGATGGWRRMRTSLLSSPPPSTAQLGPPQTWASQPEQPPPRTLTLPTTGPPSLPEVHWELRHCFSPLLRVACRASVRPRSDSPPSSGLLSAP